VIGMVFNKTPVSADNYYYYSQYYGKKSS